MLPMQWFSVDPGTQKTGWARWVGGQLKDWGLVTNRDIHATDWKLNARLMAQRVKAVVESGLQVWCEMPEEMGSATGKAALNSGSVRKLAYFVGLLGGMVLAGGGEFCPVEVHKWKGNLPKEITQKRVLRDYPQVTEGLRSDVYDAIGLGKWALKTHSIKNG